MKEVDALEAKNTLGALLDRVQRGEVVVITRHGKRVARLVPDRGVADHSRAAAAAARIRQRAAQQDGCAISPAEWKRLRDGGRRQASYETDRCRSPP